MGRGTRKDLLHHHLGPVDMEIESVRKRKTFVPKGDPPWESLIKDRMRTTVPLSNIEDPVKRNIRLNSARRSKKWRKENPDKVRASHAKYMSNPINKAKAKERDKKWREANPEKVKLYQERNKKNVKAWAEAHPERIRELGRIHDRNRRNSPRRKAWKKEYAQRPEVKEKRREYEHLRNQTPERKAQNNASKERQKQRKKLTALFAILCNIEIKTKIE